MDEVGSSVEDERASSCGDSNEIILLSYKLKDQKNFHIKGNTEESTR